jgi:glucosamine kinase
MVYFLGMDGGGTRTTAWVSDHRKHILGRAVAGPSNPLKVGLKASKQELLRAARQALRQAGLKSRAMTAVCLGLAGVARRPIHRHFLCWLRKSIPARFHLLTSDAAIALRVAVGNSMGVIVISGTGSIAYGRDERGRALRSGGWGVPFDDVGSGYDLGRKAVAAALRDLDGRGPHTQLGGRISKALGLRDITEVVLESLAPDRIAALFPTVLEAVRKRDFVARELCEQAGQELAELAVALLKRLGRTQRVIPVVCAGGVFRASGIVRRSFSKHLRRFAPGARVLLLRRPPVEGALDLARELASKT